MKILLGKKHRMHKAESFFKSVVLIPVAAVTIAAVLLTVGIQAQQVVVVPPVGLNPLNQIHRPEPPQLPIYVKNRAAAIRLGKAFFWDMQAGSDGMTACGTCHFHAGADNRLTNTLNPGTRGGDTVFGNSNIPGVPGFPHFGPNYTLDPVNDFPLHERGGTGELPTDPIVRHTNDIVGSAGIPLSDFTGVVPGSAVDSVVSDEVHPVFSVDGVNLRQVTSRNTPTVINAIFNFSNMWDGRANFIFNGVNSFGPMDPDAGVWFNINGTLEKRPVRIQFGSVASQAVGPPMDTVEMSGRGRTFPHLGRKMLSLVPLGRQLVHPEDGVLGIFSRAELQPDGTYVGNGLTTTYAQMIRSAFEDRLWNSDQLVTITLPGGQDEQFTHMEANFSMYWGLAIQLYLATLTSDETPFDHWLAGDEDAMTDLQKHGFQIFNGVGNCVECHVDTEFTSHSAAFMAFEDNFNNFLIELMFTADGTQVIYDDGFINSAVRPTADDIGRGGTAPFVNPLTGENYPLSFSELAKLQAKGLLPFETPILKPFIPNNIPSASNGAFKTPGLRNIELTGPYFHNGSVMSLEDVIDFYSRGGNFPQENIHDLDPTIGSGLMLIQGRDDLHIALESFLRALTDHRVLSKTSPFDHPEILVPEGYPEVLHRIPATNYEGQSAPVSALTLNAVFSPTGQTTQIVSGTVESGLTPTVTVDTGAAVGPVAVDGIVWSVEISDLSLGDNIITASVLDPESVLTTVTETITVVDMRPEFTSAPVTTGAVGQIYLYELTVNNPNGNLAAFELLEGPDNMFLFSFSQWGLLIWLPTAADIGDHAVTIQANDTLGFFDTQNFTVTVEGTGFAISGTITDGGAPLQGVTVSVGGASAVTNASGAYVLGGLSDGVYTLTPSLSGMVFTPASRTVTISGGNVSGQNFQAAEAPTEPVVYEAENAVLSGTTVMNVHAGFTGTGFVSFPLTATSGQSIEWTVTVPVAGLYTLEYRYALASGTRPLRIDVNGSTANASLSFAATGSWTTWRTVSMPAMLNAGSNTIRATSIGSRGANIDHLKVAVFEPPADGIYEAENARLGGPQILTSPTGFTGTGFVDYTALSGQFIEWTVAAPTAGQYTLQFRYALGAANRPLQIHVNDFVVNSSFGFPTTGSWATWGTVSMTATLNAGVNTVRAITIGSEGPNMDHLKVQ